MVVSCPAGPVSYTDGSRAAIQQEPRDSKHMPPPGVYSDLTSFPLKDSSLHNIQGTREIRKTERQNSGLMWGENFHLHCYTAGNWMWLRTLQVLLNNRFSSIFPCRLWWTLLLTTHFSLSFPPTPALSILYIYMGCSSDHIFLCCQWGWEKNSLVSGVGGMRQTQLCSNDKFNQVQLDQSVNESNHRFRKDDGVKAWFERLLGRGECRRNGLVKRRRDSKPCTTSEVSLTWDVHR